jgi:hypothetical protein
MLPLTPTLSHQGERENMDITILTKQMMCYSESPYFIPSPMRLNLGHILPLFQDQ